MDFRGPVVEVSILPSPPQDKGTARCRLAVPTLLSLGIRPGDPVVAVAPGSEHAFLCCACSLEGGGREGEDVCCVDPSVELPLSLLPGQLGAVPSGRGRVAALGRGKAGVGLVGGARAVELVCVQGIDPPAWVRVEVGRALSRSVVVAGAQVDVPELGKVRVESTVPSGAVRISNSTRVSFVAPSAPQPSTPATPSPSPSAPPRSPAPSTPHHPSTPASAASTPQPPSTPGSAGPKGRRLRIPSSQACPSPRTPNQRQPAQPPPRAIEEQFKGYTAAVTRLREVAWVLFSAHTDTPAPANANAEGSASTHTLGVRPSAGLILLGPPGTGRSTLVRALAEETCAQYVEISPHQVYGGGGGEAILREAFAATEASGALTLLHLREADRLCPKRAAGREREARVVAQLLSLMDGARGRRGGRLLVLVTTSNPSAIDEALRRPGRFDEELALGPPTLIERAEILKHCASRMPLGPRVSLDDVAGQCVGFTGADLLTLCRLAASAAVARTLFTPPRPQEDDGGGGEGLANVVAGMEAMGLGDGGGGGAEGGAPCVDLCDWEAAVAQASAAGLRGVQTGFEPLSLSAVGGLEDVKASLRQAIELPLLRPERFLQMGVRPSRGVLLHGVPGCGKTSLVRAIATRCRVGFLKANGAELYSAYLGESERILSSLFHRARTMRPCIVFLDELDAIVGSRSLEGGAGSEAAGVQQRVLSTLLNEMDGIEGAEGVVVVAATNRLAAVDAALTRPGRFDHILAVPLPDAAGRRDILRNGFRSGSLGADVDLEEVAAQAEGLTGAELERVCSEAAMCALRHAIREGKGEVGGGQGCVSAAHVAFALGTLRPAALRGDFKGFE